MDDFLDVLIYGFFISLLIQQFFRERKHSQKINGNSRKEALREKSNINYDLHEKTHLDYCVYHIKHSNHTILMGYIGVSNNFEARKQQHLLHLKKKCHVNYKLQKAWSYGEFNENSFQILHSGLSRQEAYKMEFSLRGRKDLGWNINKGGYS